MFDNDQRPAVDGKIIPEGKGTGREKIVELGLLSEKGLEKHARRPKLSRKRKKAAWKLSTGGHQLRGKSKLPQKRVFEDGASIEQQRGCWKKRLERRMNPCVATKKGSCCS